MFPDPNGVYLTRLRVADTRCFKDGQQLDLTNSNGLPARWSVLLGDNGTGKTTLLLCVLGIAPGAGGELFPFVPSERTERKSVSEEPYHFEPYPYVDAVWTNGIETKQFVDRHMGAYRSANGEPLAGAFDAPLYGYGATRRFGRTALAAPVGPVDTLLGAEVALTNPEEWLLRLHYEALLEREPGTASHRLDQALDTLTHLLPGVERIELPAAGNGASSSSFSDRIRFHTPYGPVPLSRLSLGYQTMLAWVVDLASRLFERYPDRERPLEGPAVVLVDEIDLHLHPSWQRSLIGFLTERFPNVQFIVTAHSPLVVQAAEDANIVVLRRDGDRVVIDNDPESVHGWRVDQILTSELFGLDSARPPREAELLRERTELLSRPTLDESARTRLASIDAALGELPTADTAADRKAMDLIRRAADVLRARNAP